MMKWLERVILVAGFATIGYLVWKFNPHVVFTQIRLFGWGFAAVLPLQFCDQFFNSQAWRFCFKPQDERRIPLYKLFLGRIAGDGVNYLTPSGSVAGEFIRPVVLGDAAPETVKNASVFVAKFSQSIAQMLFILCGIIFVLDDRLSFLSLRERKYATLAAFGMLIFLCVALYLAASPKSIFFTKGKWREAKEGMADYLVSHPIRFSISLMLFVVGYSAGALEAFVICHFLGMHITAATALAIEVLSNIIDSIFFMVPAKVGTQEAGKTAIFMWLGFPAAKGLAFGLIRHIRELTWATAGFLVFAWKRRQAAAVIKEAAPSSQAPGAPLPETLQPIDF